MPTDIEIAQVSNEAISFMLDVEDAFGLALTELTYHVARQRCGQPHAQLIDAKKAASLMANALRKISGDLTREFDEALMEFA